MIELCNVTKRYGAVEAVSGLSFSAPDGQIVGLLGQNGAGKTTTLNMLTGYFPPTSGEVRVDGMDMLQDPRACKRHIGYLPEKPPLYDEMTVTAYLKFVCKLREVKREAIAQHVQHITATCGLTEVAGRLVGHLSKGYRQRVGIAQALCGDPDVLVLDEPTVGLDPKQVREIRELIRQLGKTHTVIFSSHLLPEIQQLCDRVVILHKGKLVREAPMSRAHRRRRRNASFPCHHRHEGASACPRAEQSGMRAPREGAADPKRGLYRAGAGMRRRKRNAASLRRSSFGCWRGWTRR